MKRPFAGEIRVVHYWGGQPRVRTSRFDWHLAILNRCRQKGWKSTIVFSSVLKNEDVRDALGQNAIECVYIDRPRRQFSFVCVRDAYRAFKQTHCTIAHFHCVHTSPIIGAALAGVPVRIWSNHSSEYRDDGRSVGWLHRLAISTRVTCALAHKILPVSSSLLEELRRHGVPEHRMQVAPVSVSLKRYQLHLEQRQAARHALGLADDQIIVCSVGQGIFRKGWDVLIRAFAQAAERNRRMHLVLVGSMTGKQNGEPDEYQRGLIQLAHQLGVHDRVRFLGIRYDVADILSASDIFAFPSRAEGLALAPLEAMAMGLPCVASSVGGIPEFVRDGENGLLVQSENVRALSQALLKLAVDEVLRQHLSQNARASVEPFSVESQAERIVNLYEEMLAARGLV